MRCFSLFEKKYKTNDEEMQFGVSLIRQKLSCAGVYKCFSSAVIWPSFKKCREFLCGPGKGKYISVVLKTRNQRISGIRTVLRGKRVGAIVLLGTTK